MAEQLNRIARGSGDRIPIDWDQDRDRIDVSEEHECLYWTKSLGLTYAELKEVVIRVGPRVKSVKGYLGR